MEQDESSQGDNDSIDIEFPKYYHLFVNEDDYCINLHQAGLEMNVNLWVYNTKDSDEVRVINDELSTFRSVSLKLEPNGLCDLRLL